MPADAVAKKSSSPARIECEVHKYIFDPPGQVLRAYYYDNSPVSIIPGPLGSAKTTTTCYKLMRLAMQQRPNAQGVRPVRIIAIRNTYSELLSTTAKDWLAIWGELGHFSPGSKEPPRYTAKLRLPEQDNTVLDMEVLFIALDRPGHVKKLRGHQVTWFWLSETKELSKEIIDMADLRHGRYPSRINGGVECTISGMVGDTNQCDEDHWLYEYQEIKKPAGDLPDWAFFRQPPAVIKRNGRYVINPDAENIKNLPSGYYDKRIQGKREDWIRVNICNEYGFVSDGKPVHPEYSEQVHYINEMIAPVKSMPLILGFDFGRTPACVMLQLIGDTWYVLDEFCGEDVSAALFAPALSRYISSNYAQLQVRGWGDPAGSQKGQATESSAIDVLRAHDIPCDPCGTNDPVLRRAAVSRPLTELTMAGKPRLIVTAGAPMVRKGLGGKFCYRRIQVSGDARYTDQPDKNIYSHPVEALEYALLGEGEGYSEITMHGAPVGAGGEISVSARRY